MLQSRCNEGRTGLCSGWEGYTGSSGIKKDHRRPPLLLNTCSSRVGSEGQSLLDNGISELSFERVGDGTGKIWDAGDTSTTSIPQRQNPGLSSSVGLRRGCRSNQAFSRRQQDVSACHTPGAIGQSGTPGKNLVSWSISVSGRPSQCRELLEQR